MCPVYFKVPPCKKILQKLPDCRGSVQSWKLLASEAMLQQLTPLDKAITGMGSVQSEAIIAFALGQVSALCVYVVWTKEAAVLISQLPPDFLMQL
eukprot:1160546-Pelagomonas_calceolata.AAC.9